MPRRFLTLLVSLLITFSATAEISIEMMLPKQGELTESSVLIQVKVDSEFEIDTVTASFEDRSVALHFELIPIHSIFVGVWTGILDLEGYSGEMNASVTVIDKLGNTHTAETNSFMIDALPVITLIEPLDFSVATPNIRLIAACADDSEAPCQLIVEAVVGYDSFTVLETAASANEEILDLSAFDHSEITLRVTATDSSGQSTSEQRTIYVESNPRLTPIETVSGRILDFSDSRLLYTQSNDDIHSLEIFDRATDESTLVYRDQDSSIYEESCNLTPLGALFSIQQQDSERLVDISGDQFLDLGEFNERYSLKVKDRYAIWNVGQTLILRDLIEKTNTTVSETAANIGNDVSDTGVVAYSYGDATEGQISIYRDGTNTQLTNDSEIQNFFVRTDGNNVVYTKKQIVDGEESYSIALHDGVEERILLVSGMDSTFYDLDFGWVVLGKPGTSDQWQVWMSKANEEPIQRTFFSSTSHAIAFNERGELIFENEERASKYLSFPDGRFKPLGNYIGQTTWQNGHWYVVIGRTLFTLDTQRTPNPIILDFSMGEDEIFHLEFEPQTGQTLMLQSSENMRDWSDISEIEASENSIVIESPEALSSSPVFYRLLIQ